MIGTVFFNWYGVQRRHGELEPAGSQWTSAWEPLDGRLSWDGSPAYYERHLRWVHEAGLDYILVQCPENYEQNDFRGYIENLLDVLERLNREWDRKLQFAPYLARESFIDRVWAFDDSDRRQEFAEHVGSWLRLFAAAPLELWARDPWEGRPMMGMWAVRKERGSVPKGLADDWRDQAEALIGERLFIHGHGSWPRRAGLDMTSWLFNGMEPYKVWLKPNGKDARAVDLLVGFMNVVADSAKDYFHPRARGKTYREAWRWVIGNADKFDLVVIESWNEEHEGSGLRPAAPGQKQHSAIPRSEGRTRREAALTQTRGEIAYEDAWGPPHRYVNLTKELTDEMRAQWG